MKQMTLLNPGPVNVTSRVAASLMRGDMCHREKEFEDLMANIRRKLLLAFDVEKSFHPVLISGSGTAALEMAVSSCLSKGRSMLIIENGVYGERIAKMVHCRGFKKHSLHWKWGQPPNLEQVESAIKSHPEIEVIAMVHHETTTGLLNPINEVGLLARQYGKRFLVDCISSLAGDEIDLNGWGLDFCVGTANKCLQGLPGVSFVLFRSEETERLSQTPSPSLYLNLYENYKSQEDRVPLFTPAVQLHYALEESLSELIEETVSTRIQRYKNSAQLLRDGFENLGLEFFIPRNLFSNCLTSLKLPPGISYDDLHTGLRKKGFVIYAGQGNLRDDIFRIANIGNIQLEEFERFLGALEECLFAKSK